MAMIKKLRRKGRFELIAQTTYYVRDTELNIDLSFHSHIGPAAKHFNSLPRLSQKRGRGARNG
jgi:hypothetical protein